MEDRVFTYEEAMHMMYFLFMTLGNMSNTEAITDGVIELFPIIIELL